MVAAVVVVVGVALAPVSRSVLVNTTPSEPIGLYARTHQALRPGRLVAFLAPASAFPYADRRLGYLHRVPLLKMIVAGPGDRVCTLTDQLLINGQVYGAIAEADAEGRALPHWRACRALADGELFALADRVPNSFDSRYFGPISERSVIGVFRPLFLLGDAE
jgi:conjugative transfer signal peptidase TraF